MLELGYVIPESLHFVPVDFEAGDSWREKLNTSGFKKDRPTVIASTGVSMYLTKEANVAALAEIASFAPGSILAMTFLLPLELVDDAERAQHQMVYERARAAGTPFISFFKPQEILEFALAAGFSSVKHISRSDLIDRYFRNRSDSLVPASGEEFLVATL